MRRTEFRHAFVYAFLSLIASNGCRIDGLKPIDPAIVEDLKSKIGRSDTIEVRYIWDEPDRVPIIIPSSCPVFHELSATLLDSLRFSDEGPLGGPVQQLIFKSSIEGKIAEVGVGDSVWIDNKAYALARYRPYETQFREIINRYYKYYSSGETKANGGFDRGNRRGHWVFFYKNGKKMAEGEYDDGSMIGTWDFWNAEGERSTKFDVDEATRTLDVK